jgi:lipopolysaccharide transport system permease protein
MFWLTPVFYPVQLIPNRYRAAYELNPVAALIVSLRNVLVDGRMPSLQTLGLGAMVATALFLIGLVTFGLMEGNFGDYL